MDLTLFKVRVALPGFEDNVKAKNNGDIARVQAPRAWWNIHTTSLGTKAELRAPNNLCSRDAPNEKR